MKILDGNGKDDPVEVKDDEKQYSDKLQEMSSAKSIVERNEPGSVNILAHRLHVTQLRHEADHFIGGVVVASIVLFREGFGNRTLGHGGSATGASGDPEGKNTPHNHRHYSAND